MHRCLPELLIKGTFLFLTVVYATVTYRDTQDRSPSNPSYTEWDVCWPVASWYISWHAGICLSVVSLPSRLFRLDVDDVVGQNIPQGPDWYRLSILFAWYLAGVPTAYMMYDTCAVGAPGTWARGIRVFIEGIVAFGLGGFIYVGAFPFWIGANGANLEHFIWGLFFDRGWDVVFFQCTTPVRYYCRIHRRKCHQVQTSIGPVVQ